MHWPKISATFCGRSRASADKEWVTDEPEQQVDQDRAEGRQSFCAGFSHGRGRFRSSKTRVPSGDFIDLLARPNPRTLRRRALKSSAAVRIRPAPRAAPNRVMSLSNRYLPGRHHSSQSMRAILARNSPVVWEPVRIALKQSPSLERNGPPPLSATGRPASVGSKPSIRGCLSPHSPYN